MGMTIAQKILKAHLVDGEMVLGQEIGLKIDQTLTQDATGTMAYLQFEAMGIDRVKTELSVAYIDHNTLQNGFENADDHRYIQTVAKKHGLRFSRPGNGICHQVHLERFGIPGKTLIGSDSHTPTGGGIGMLAGATGGYLWTYPLLALGAGLGKNRWQRALFSLSGLAVLEIVGACQLAHFTGAPIWPYIAMFVPKDMIVVLLAVLPAEKMRRILKWEKF